jgi:hypothetical protein
MLKEKVKEKRFGSVRLQMFATEQTYTGERSNLGYKLFSGKTLIFQGEDFRPSAMDAIDSDAAAFSLLGFLTLQPGDTDREPSTYKYIPEEFNTAETKCQLPSV